MPRATRTRIRATATNPLPRTLCAATLTFALTLVLAWPLSRAFTVTDADWYLRLAQGDQTGVMQPFASRQLGPLVVHALAALLHRPVEQAFLIQGLASFALVLVFVFSRATLVHTPAWLFAALVLIPFWPQLLIGLALPDLWYAALLCLFLWLLARDQLLLAAAMMFPLMLSRESTSLTLLCFLLTLRGTPRSRVLPAACLALVAAAAGSAAVYRLALHGSANSERLPQSLYLLAKIPWNLPRNLLGILPWSNVYPWHCYDAGPAWQMPLHLGPIRAIGLCSFSPVGPRNVVIALTTTFGLLPVITLALKWAGGGGHSRGQAAVGPPHGTPFTADSSTNPGDLLFRFTLLYGTLSFLLAPVLGVALPRLAGYAWPLFLVALPMLAQRAPSRSLTPVTIAALLTLHLALGLCALTRPTLLIAALGLLLNAAALLILRVHLQPLRGAR